MNFDPVMRKVLTNTDCTDYTDKSLRLGDSCYLWDSCLFLSPRIVTLDANSPDQALKHLTNILVFLYRFLIKVATAV